MPVDNRAAPAAKKPPRMTLSSISQDRAVKPPRLLVAGTEGVGKSTFAASAPTPVFLGPEDGTGQLNVARFPLPETWTDVLDALRELDGEHPYKTIVLDTLDWLEPLAWKHVCDQAGCTSIEDLGYGKGYVKALDEWRMMLSLLERLRARGMTTILLAHTHIRPFKNPDGEDFDRYELKLNIKAAGLLKEWCDAVLFASYETIVKTDQRTKRTRGIDTGARFLHTTRQAAYDAKNRFNLPPAIPLAWDDFDSAMKAGAPASAPEMRQAIEANLAGLDPAAAEKARGALGRAGDDAKKLAQLNDWVNGQMARNGVAA